jgi:penicillin-binding protein 1C
MRGVSGVTGAAPVWLELMQALHAAPGATPAAPRGVVRELGEWFIAGTAPSTERAASAVPADVRISYPGAGAILALDPDIPPAMQRVFLSAAGAGKAVWVLDGKRLGRADAELAWSPVAGRHALQLVAEGGRVLDRVEFQVRGHAVPP